MGLDYALSMVGNLSPAEATDCILHQPDIRRLDSSFLVGRAVRIGVRAPTQEWQTMIAEGFHFTPNLLVLFRLDHNDEGYEEGLRLMIRATQRLLRQTPGDAVLLFSGEHIILQRLQGHIVLNADHESWLEGYRLIDEIHLPHEIRSLPSPL